MQLSPEPTTRPRRPAFALITLLPLLWLLCVTMTAGTQKIFHSKPSIGFLAKAKQLQDLRPGLQSALAAATTSGNSDAIKAAEKALRMNRNDYVNQYVDTIAAGFFLVLVAIIFLMSVREW